MEELKFIVETSARHIHVTQETLDYLMLSDEEIAAREQQPLRRNRVVSKALRAYAQSVTSADKGGVRLLSED